MSTQMDSGPVIFLLEFIPRKQIRQLEKEVKYTSTHQGMTQQTRNDTSLLTQKNISWYINRPPIIQQNWLGTFRMHTFHVIEYNSAMKIRDSEICTGMRKLPWYLQAGYRAVTQCMSQWTECTWDLNMCVYVHVCASDYLSIT